RRKSVLRCVSTKASPSSHSSGAILRRSCRAPRQEMRSSFTRSARPRRRAEPWTAASMSSMRRAGKRAATCAERLPPSHSFPPSSRAYHPRPSLPPVGDGRGLAAVLALGASGAWIGTRFLASNEAAIHPRYRKRLLKATENDTVFLEELFNVGW